jgi:hypothetical protein
MLEQLWPGVAIRLLVTQTPAVQAGLTDHVWNLEFTAETRSQGFSDSKESERSKH